MLSVIAILWSSAICQRKYRLWEKKPLKKLLICKLCDFLRGLFLYLKEPFTGVS